MARWRVERLLLGDCLDVLRSLPSASAHALVTDPPAAISMMGEEWDHDRGGRDEWIAWLAERLRESRRVLVADAYALVWALPRTSHWTAFALEHAGWNIVDSVHHLMASGYPKAKNLKPAHEVWWLARQGKPVLNVEACRVEPSGRRPSNVLLSHSEDCTEEACAPDCSIVELDRQSGETVSRIGKPRHLNAGMGWGMTMTGKEYNDRGGASRFYSLFRYCAKAKRSERDAGLSFRGNTHPCTKPLALMRWLVRLVTPVGGCVLDPFLGSGTTAMAARLETRRIIGIDNRADYVAIAQARLASVNKVSTY